MKNIGPYLDLAARREKKTVLGLNELKESLSRIGGKSAKS
jgi:hypothetical protein